MKYHFQTPQEKMLDSCVKIIQQTGANSYTAFNQMLEWLAFHLTVPNAQDPFVEEVSNKFKKLFSKELLQEDPWDWLGEVAEKLEITNFRSGQFFTPRTVSDAMAAMSLNNPSKDRIITILDPCIGSGRLILSAFKLMGYHALYYGCDIDLFAYRIALLNMKLYEIPALLLRCDSLKYSIALDSSNWEMANQWNGPDWALLKAG